LLLVLSLQIILYDVFNPSIPVIIWFVVLYWWSTHFLLAAMGLGTTFQIGIATQVRVVTTDMKTYEGYLVGKGSDHYHILTKDKDMAIPSSSILRIERLPPQKEKTETVSQH
jgi:hypothetical protein